MRYAPEVKTIEQRLTDLENTFADIKSLKGIPGPRGPGGPIEAAVDNATVAANQVVTNAENRVRAIADARYNKFEEEIAQLREEFKQLKADLDERIHTEIENTVVRTLQDYHVLGKDTAAPTCAYFKHEIRAIVAEMLASK